MTEAEQSNLSTVEACNHRLRELAVDPLTRDWFNWQVPITAARAPGRLDLMGGFADYSGSLVLEQTIAESVLVAVQPCSEPQLELLSLPVQAAGKIRRYRVDLPTLRAAAAGPADSIPATIGVTGDQHWAAYLAGVVPVLLRDAGLSLSGGVRILVDSRVPEGKGVSSSAAIEVATMFALVGAYGLDLSGDTIARLCQRVEHQVAGAPCGIMDQMAVTFGQEHKLMALLCRPADRIGQIELPSELAVWALDSGEQHSVAGADYVSVRTAAFMGHRILMHHLGLSVEANGTGRVQVAEDPWSGYLCAIPVPEYETTWRDVLPERMPGQEFLQRYEGTVDAVTRVDPDRSYAVRTCTEFPIYQMARVAEFSRRLTSPLDDTVKQRLGTLMFEFHDGYRLCGVDSPRTRQLVAWVQAAVPGSGLYGAKITGGGSGGTVAILGDAHAEEAVAGVVRQFVETYGEEPYRFSGSSEGAAETGSWTFSM